MVGSHRAKKEHNFIKDNMTGDDDHIDVKVKTIVSFMIDRIPKKDAWS